MFQSTFPQGERPSAASSFPLLTVFQSTFPQGERLDHLQRADQHPRFNPRSRKGNDFFDPFFKIDFFRFNPRSRKGNDLEGEDD